MNGRAPEISVVIPAYNEESRLGATLERILAYFEGSDAAFEIIVVDDGSTDRTSEVAKATGKVRVEKLERNRGKGAAVRTGMLIAQAPWVLFCDADLATPVEELDRLLAQAARRQADVVVGTRAHAESDIRVRQPVRREMMGRVFNLFVRSMMLSDFKDTQCGFKLFTREAARRIFSHARVDRFAFDVEVLLLAKKMGLKVVEVPVAWRHFEQSSVSPTGDAPRMLLDLLVLRLRLTGWREPNSSPDSNAGRSSTSTRHG